MEDDVERSQLARVVKVCVPVRRLHCSVDVHRPAFDTTVLVIVPLHAALLAF